MNCNEQLRIIIVDEPVEYTQQGVFFNCLKKALTNSRKYVIVQTVTIVNAFRNCYGTRMFA